MNTSKIYIVGNGVAGVNTAISFRKLSDTPICIVSEESDYFFSRTALMYIFMGQMRFKDTKPYEDSFWNDQKIELKKARVKRIESQSKKIIFEDGSWDTYSKLVIATGSVPLKLPFENGKLMGIYSLYHLQDLENLTQLYSKIKQASIIGGGLIGVELAEMLVSKDIEVNFLIRESYFWSNVISEKEGKLIEYQIRKHGVKLYFNTEVKAFEGNEKNELVGIETSNNERILSQYAAITIGVKPNLSFELEGLDINKGIKVDEYLQTNIADVFAVGDCAELASPANGRRAIEAVWYTARQMGETLGKTLAGNKTRYEQGNWFNSAKFFDLEYQTYGLVPAVCGANESDFYFEKDGKLIRIVYAQDSRLFLGINTWGIRLRHDFFEKILNQKRPIDFVIDKIEFAFFDPEFYPTYGKEIKSTFKTAAK